MGASPAPGQESTSATIKREGKRKEREEEKDAGSKIDAETDQGRQLWHREQSGKRDYP
jgi:hypothetical protein